MAKKKNVLSKVEHSPAELIRQAVTGGADLDKLTKLLELQEKWDATQAKKAYHIAMAGFKANPPKIGKDKLVIIKHKNGPGSTKYSHASLANVCEKVNAGLSKHGLSAAWSTKQNGNVEVTCKITHIQGHSEETTLIAPADNTGLKNAIQQIASTVTYLQRYTLLALTGLAAHDQDDDGKGTDEVSECITTDESIFIQNEIANVGGDMKKLLKFVKVDKVENILKSDYSKVLKLIDDKRKLGKK